VSQRAKRLQRWRRAAAVGTWDVGGRLRTFADGTPGRIRNRGHHTQSTI